VGSPVSVSVQNGQAQATYPLPPSTLPGTYTVTASYSDPTGNFAGTSTTGTLIVESAPTTVSVSNLTVPFASNDPTLTLQATVTTPQGIPVNEGQVQFVVTNSAGAQVGPTVTANVSNGQASASFTLPAETPLGTYTITATYTDPSGKFAGSTGSGTLNIVPSPTTVFINNVNIVYSLFSVQETFTAFVLDSFGKTVNEGFVTFTDGGQSVTVPIINNQATATLTIPVFAENPFAHPVNVGYSDNTGNFLSSSSLFTLQQTLMEFLIQILALEVAMKNNSSNA
jgi:hypothetical protein